MDMATGMGTTVKQVNNLQIKLGIDGLYRVYPKGTYCCEGEFATLKEAIAFCQAFQHPLTVDVRIIDLKNINIKSV